MPRPKRTRQASKAAAEPETRGRSRRTRSMVGTRHSTENSQAREEAPVGDETVESVEVGRRTRTPQRRDTTGLDLADDDMFGDLDDSFEKGDVPSDGRFADNSSLYGSSHVKPRSRSRQSSIIRPASRGGNTPLVGSSSLNLGAFRRRAREPSILGTGRKAHPDVSHITATTHDRQSDSEQDEEEEEDFAPEAESTPINNRRRTRASLRSQASPELPQLSGSRKRKSDGVVPDSDRPEKTSRTEEPQQDQDDSDSESDLSSLPSPGALPLLAERPVTPNREDYAAPPASSDADDDADFWPDIHSLAKKRRRPSITDPLQGDNASVLSSPPSLTHSPNDRPAKTTRARGRQAGSPPPLTTADLANLLPKRRVKKPSHSRAGVESDNEEHDVENDDQDELALRSTRQRKTTTRSAPAKEPEAPASNTRSASRRKTYSRRTSDKENHSDAEDDEAEESMFQPLADDTFESTEARGAVLSAEELKEAAMKFKEVDRWELSFEEASEPESPVGAR